MQLEPPLPGAGIADDTADEQVFTLYTEAKEMSLVRQFLAAFLRVFALPLTSISTDRTAL